MLDLDRDTHTKFVEVNKEYGAKYEELRREYESKLSDLVKEHIEDIQSPDSKRQSLGSVSKLV